MKGENSNDKEKQTGYHKELEKALWLWLCNTHSRNLVVSDEMLQEKGREFGQRLGDSEGFSYSRGWLQGFKHRHKISLRTIQSEATSFSEALVTEGCERLLDVLTGY